MPFKSAVPLYSSSNGLTLHGPRLLRGSRIVRMRLFDLADTELGTAAQACRAMSFKEGERLPAIATSMRWLSFF